jgi:hypothetical protein
MDIGVGEMPSRAQHAHHLGEETRKVRVAVRGFDIEHHVEGFVVEGQVLGVASHEIRTGQIVPFLAKLDAGRVQVQSRVGGRLQGAHEV